MKNIKKIISITICICMLSGLFSSVTSMTVYAEQTETTVRLAGKNRYQTSFVIADAIKENLSVERFNTAIIASGSNFPDALAGSYLASKYSAPILLVDEQNPEEVISYIEKNGCGKVYILGGTAAVPDCVYTQLTSMGCNVTKLYGSTRYQTNLEILNESQVTAGKLLVCTGNDFADSLSASAVGFPILLVDGKNALTTEQKSFLRNIEGCEIYIIGGEGAINTTIEEELKTYGSVVRISGKTRFETSVAVSEYFFKDPKGAIIACAMNFPDGLCGGALAQIIKYPLVLTADYEEVVAKKYVEDNSVEKGIVLGGTGVLSETTIKNIFNVLTIGNVVTIVTQPESVTVADGEKARVTFEVVGDGLTYEWYIKNAGETSFKKSSSFSENTYTTVMNEQRAGRQLYCKVTDKYGNSVTTDTVTIDMKVDTITPPANSEYPYVCDKLSWEKIQSFPIASDDMSIEELRAHCVEFFRFTKSFAWTPSEDFYYIRTTTGKEDSVLKGTVYGGLPYIHKGSGNVYRVMDFYDPETGVLDLSTAEENPRLFGSQCSLGSYWAWGRVINSAQFGSTYHMVPSRGFIPLGEYIYDESVADYREGPNTIKICNANEDQVMYESYALLQPADGLVYYRGGGHVIMCSEAPVVVRNEDGTINPKKSYVKYIDQAQTWENQKQSNGDTYSVKKNIDAKYTFSKLLKEYYIPFTFAEFLGTDPVEELEFLFDYAESSISVHQLQQVAITANYGMSDLYAFVKDQNGNLVYSDVKRMETASVVDTMFADAIDEQSMRQYSNGDHSIEVVAQFVNGERLTLYTGQLKE